MGLFDCRGNAAFFLRIIRVAQHAGLLLSSSHTAAPTVFPSGDPDTDPESPQPESAAASSPQDEFTA
jgi:hypothetical protein